MSRPKTGSVTDRPASGENGTWLTHSRTVSQAAETDAADDRGRRTRRPRPAPSRPSGVRSGRSPASNDDRRRAAERLAPVAVRRAGPAAPRSSAAWAASLSRSTKPAQRAADRRPGGGAAVGRATGCRAGRRAARTIAPTNRPRVAVSRVQKTESKPTLAYHSASVHRSSPTPNRSTRPRIATIADREPEPPPGTRRADRRAVRRRSGRRGPRRRGGPSRRGPRGSVGVGSSGSASVVDGSPSPDRRRDPPRRRRPSVVGVVVVRRDRRRFGGAAGVRILAAGGRFAAPQLLHEIVEQVAHVRRVYAARDAQRRAALRSTRRKPVRTVSASSFGRIVAARAGSNRKAARIATGRATAGRAAPAARSARGASGAGRRPRGSARTGRR